jgi:DnaD/phage-associated family protein
MSNLSKRGENMGYYLNPAQLVSMFPVPASVVDEHIKLATETQLKVLLYGIKHADKSFDIAFLSEALSIDSSEVTDALDFWAGFNILCSTEQPQIIKDDNSTVKASVTKPNAILKNAVKPTREESARRGLECPEVAFILHETELKFGRGLRQSEISSLVWLYDDQGLSASLILMLVGFAVSEGRANIGFIERTALEWINDGVTDIDSAERRLIDLRQKRSAWHLVETAMGIEHRSPSKAELEAANTWVNEWGYDREVLRAAYEACVDSTSKFSMPYIKKISSEWHKSGVKTIDDIERLTAKSQKTTKSNGDQYLELMNAILRSNEED